MNENTSKNKSLKIILLVVAIGLVVGLVYYAQRDDGSNSPQTKTDQSQDQSDKTNSGQQSSSITKSDAEKIATDKFGGTVKETEDDTYNGTPAWEVEIRDSQQGRIEVKVDKVTGAILSTEKN